MPTDSLLVAVCVVAMFVVFAAVLFWGDLQTRSKDWPTLPTASAAPSDRAGAPAAGPSGGRARLTGCNSDEPALLMHVNTPDACQRFGCGCSSEASF